MATSLGQMATELAAVNPWWRDPAGWASKDPDLHQARSSGLGYDPRCLEGLEAGGLYLLRGPRRVGKTVTVKQTIDTLLKNGVAPRSIVRVAADGWAAKDIRTMVQRASIPSHPPGTHRWWFIDEITAVYGDWATQVKWLRDNDQDFREATVVLTGSNAAALTGAAGLLAGRRGATIRQDRTLLPMGFATFARLMDPSLPAVRLELSQLRTLEARSVFDELSPWLADLRRHWELYLLHGGFPVSVAAARDGEEPPEWFVADIFNVIYRDAFGQGSLSVNSASELVARVMAGMANPMNMSSIASDLGLDGKTVRRHVDYLRNAYLVWHCPQKTENEWVARSGSQDKVYAIDPLVARLTHLRNQARPDIDVTILTEMQIGVALHRAMLADGSTWAADANLFHARTPTRKEIDFVSAELAGAAIEGKYVETGRWASEAATVDASEWSGVLTTRNVLNTSATDNRAWAVPASLLAYAIDS